MITREQAMKIRAMTMSVAKDMDDQEASTMAEIFPKLKQNGSIIKAGTRINWNGTLVKSVSDLHDTAENSPENAPGLWVILNYVNGYRTIPEDVTTATSFSKGEKGWWKNSIYESVFDGVNTWNPEQFAAGWKII